MIKISTSRKNAVSVGALRVFIAVVFRHVVALLAATHSIVARSTLGLDLLVAGAEFVAVQALG